MTLDYSLAVADHTAGVDSLKTHYVEAGEGPLVLLLHGFPETWLAWRHQIPVLAQHYHVVAPDLRGYGQHGALRRAFADYRATKEGHRTRRKGQEHSHRLSDAGPLGRRL